MSRTLVDGISIVFCTACGAARAGGRFCGECGSLQEWPAPGEPTASLPADDSPLTATRITSSAQIADTTSRVATSERTAAELGSPGIRDDESQKLEVRSFGAQAAVDDVKTWWQRQTPRDQWAYRALAAMFIPLFLIAGVLVVHDKAHEDACERANRLDAKIRALELQDALPVDYTKLDQYPSLSEMRQLYDDSAEAIRDCVSEQKDDADAQ